MRIELEQPDQEKSSASDSFVPPKDEKRTIKTEFQKMKEMGFKEGWKYFWDYYRNTVLVSLVILICVVSLVFSIVRNKRPYVIQVSLYNNYISEDTDTDAFCQSFADHMEVNLKDYQMLFSASDYFDPDTPSEEMTAVFYKFAAMIAAGDLDISGGDRVFMDYYSYGEPEEVYFCDLEEVLPSDLFSMLKADGRIYYSKYTDENGNVTGEYASGIEISHSRLTDEAGLQITPCYIGIICNTKRLDTAIEFIRWIFYLD